MSDENGHSYGDYEIAFAMNDEPPTRQADPATALMLRKELRMLRTLPFDIAEQRFVTFVLDLMGEQP